MNNRPQQPNLPPAIKKLGSAANALHQSYKRAMHLLESLLNTSGGDNYFFEVLRLAQNYQGKYNDFAKAVNQALAIPGVDINRVTETYQTYTEVYPTAFAGEINVDENVHQLIPNISGATTITPLDLYRLVAKELTHGRELRLMTPVEFVALTNLIVNRMRLEKSTQLAFIDTYHAFICSVIMTGPRFDADVATTNLDVQDLPIAQVFLSYITTLYRFLISPDDELKTLAMDMIANINSVTADSFPLSMADSLQGVAYRNHKVGLGAYRDYLRRLYESPITQSLAEQLTYHMETTIGSSILRLGNKFQQVTNPYPTIIDRLPDLLSAATAQKAELIPLLFTNELFKPKCGDYTFEGMVLTLKADKKVLEAYFRLNLSVDVATESLMRTPDVLFLVDFSAEPVVIADTIDFDEVSPELRDLILNLVAYNLTMFLRNSAATVSDQQQEKLKPFYIGAQIVSGNLDQGPKRKQTKQPAVPTAPSLEADLIADRAKRAHRPLFSEDELTHIKDTQSIEVYNKILAYHQYGGGKYEILSHQRTPEGYRILSIRLSDGLRIECALAESDTEEGEATLKFIRVSDHYGKTVSGRDES
jgi:hypothetical protein